MFLPRAIHKVALGAPQPGSRPQTLSPSPATLLPGWGVSTLQLSTHPAAGRVPRGGVTLTPAHEQLPPRCDELPCPRPPWSQGCGFKGRPGAAKKSTRETARVSIGKKPFI